MQADGDSTRLPDALRQDSPEGEARLMDLTYRELRKIAAGHLRRERSARSLQTTDLVHEAYLRLVEQAGTPWRDRAHFFQIAAHVMRQILVDRARKRHAGKRGGGVPQISLDKALNIAEARSADRLMLEEALARLQQVDGRQCQVVEMRFFVGLGAKEIALVLNTSEATVRRDWLIAKAWLFRHLEGSASS